MSDKTEKPVPPPPASFAAERNIVLLRRIRLVEVITLLTGTLIILINSGFSGASVERIRHVNELVICILSVLGFLRLTRFILTVTRRSVLSAFMNAGLLVPVLWLVGTIFLVQRGTYSSDTSVAGLVWTHASLGVIVVFSILTGCRRLAARTNNSAVLLVGSFLVVILAGTLLLKLPVCRAHAPGEAMASADWNVALFTATSACCVTGLIVEPTGSYWSPVGHAVIFSLFQIGGLGILTFGAFIAVLSGRRGLQFREARTLREMLDTDSLRDARRLLLTILTFTLLIEAAGAFSLLGLWPDLPLPSRIWHAVFHSVSAFCNAGFSLHDDGFLNMGSRWQVWGPLSWLIILGGLGFPVMYDVWTWIRRRFHSAPVTTLFGDAGRRPRVTLHTRLVLLTTGSLLVFGAVFWYLLEAANDGMAAAPESTMQSDTALQSSKNPDTPRTRPVSASRTAGDESVGRRMADAWFQSVTFRTAGFNTVDHETMNPATKLLAIFLMFIGAAPGSTGGGIKTIVFALTLLNIRAVFRGQHHVEAFGRRIPTSQVSRALSMIAFGLLIVLVTTGLLVIFENQPERFLDHLYEATSAFATVGVSAGITAELTMPSRLLICIVMFLGRVGPVTLLLAMASSSEAPRYDYPEERVSLG